LTDAYWQSKFAQIMFTSGAYFNGQRRADPHPRASDPAARRELRELSDRLCGPAA
jgi:hypothetical protein